VHAYVRDLEEVLLRALSDFGIEGARVPGLTGVWVEDAKIAAIGVRVARWVTSHGFALNVAPDLEYFEAIVPCGIRSGSVTSMERILAKVPSMKDVALSVGRRFAEVFEREVV